MVLIWVLFLWGVPDYTVDNCHSMLKMWQGWMLESYPPAYVHLMPSKQRLHGQSCYEDICTIVTTIPLNLGYNKIDIIDYLLPPSRHPDITMRIQRHAVLAWLPFEHIAAYSTAVAVYTSLFGAYLSRRHFVIKIREVYDFKRPAMKMANGGYLVGCMWAVIGCRFYGITPRAECEGCR